MIGDRPFFGRNDDLVLAFQAADDPVDGAEEILLLDLFLIVAGGDQGRLVADVGDVGARESRSLAGQEVAVELRIELQVFQVHVENFTALFQVGQFDVDLAVEASGPQQRFVEDVGPVRGGQHDHAGVRSETVHLGQQLVQRIFSLVVRRIADVLAARPPDRVDLVDEDDAGRFFFCLPEQVAHPRRADADEHLDEVGTADRKERHVRLSGHGFRQQRLTGSRRAYEQGAFRNFAAQVAVLARVFQEIDDFHDFHFSFFESGDVLERDVDVRILVEHLRFGLADAEDPAAAAIVAARHAPPQEPPDSDEDQDREDQRKCISPDVAARFETERNFLIVFGLRVFQVVLEIVERPDIERELGPLFGDPFVLFPVGVGRDLVGFQVDLGRLFVHDDDFLQVSLFDHLLHAVPCGRVRHFLVTQQSPREDHHGQDHPNPVDVEFRTFAPQLGHIVVMIRFHVCYVMLLSKKSTVGPLRYCLTLRIRSGSPERRPRVVRVCKNRATRSEKCAPARPRNPLRPIRCW